MSIKSELEKLALSVPRINENRNYWFVRTEGGDYYENFISGNYIAIGYNEVSLYTISQNFDSKNIDGSIATFTEKVKGIYPKEKRPGLISSQLIRFTYSIKKGDIVIVPSESSQILHFGEVQKTVTYLEEKEDGCPYKKRKQVRWIKAVSKYKLEAEFYKMIFTHLTVSNADDYAVFIDRSLNSFFIKGNNTHLVLDVKTHDEIEAQTFYDFGEIFKLQKELCEAENIKSEGQFNVKTNVQSPGFLEIIQSNALPIGLLALGLILVALAGGGFGGKIKINKKVGLDAEVKSTVPVGIIAQIDRLLKNRRQDKIKADIVKKCLEELKIESPEDLVKLLDKNKDDKENI